MKKSKVWNDKHYKRMQTIFESQGIKANFVFESPINSEAVLPEDQSAEERRRELADLEAALKKPSTDVQKKTQPASPWSPNPKTKRPGGENGAPDWGAGDLEMEEPTDYDGYELDPEYAPDAWDATKDDPNYYDLVGTHPDGYPLRRRIK